jgi:ribosome-binding protein aMBF1 (putative translation factor)
MRESVWMTPQAEGKGRERRPAGAALMTCASAEPITTMPRSRALRPPDPAPRTEDLKETRRALGRKLAEARDEKGLSQPELGALIQFDRRTISDAETAQALGSRELWRRADTVLGARGQLVAAREAVHARIKADAEAKAREDRRRKKRQAAFGQANGRIAEVTADPAVPVIGTQEIDIQCPHCRCTFPKLIMVDTRVTAEPGITDPGRPLDLIRGRPAGLGQAVSA